MSEQVDAKNGKLGLVAMALAAMALVGAVLHMSVGSFAPQKPAEVTIAEFAVNVKDAAAKLMTGEQEEVTPKPFYASWDVDQIFNLGVLSLAGLAMLVAIFALARKEPQRPAYTGFALGVGVLSIVFLKWIALVICGVILLVVIINNIGDILSF